MVEEQNITMKIAKDQFHQIIAPRSIALVTTIDKNKKINAAPLSFVSPISFQPPILMLALSPSRHTYQNIIETKEFVLNFFGKEDLDKVLRCAKNYPKGINELQQAGLKWYSSELVNPPRVKEAKVWIECKLLDEKKMGDHLSIFGEVLVIEVKDEIITDGKVDIKKLSPALHISKDQFAVDFNVIKHKRYD